jgi:hypothetical protein
MAADGEQDLVRSASSPLIILLWFTFLIISLPYLFTVSHSLIAIRFHKIEIAR